MVKKAITVSLLLLVAFGLLKLILFWEVGPVPGEQVTQIPSSPAGTDSVEMVAGGQYDRGKVGRFFWEATTGTYGGPRYGCRY